jgi:O-antigen/teichoic acid export membrane protein
MLKRIDGFSRNLLVVFAGTALLNFFNLACQLLIAHRLTPVDFAIFNSLLSLFMIISAPFTTIQSGVAKFISEFTARGERDKAKIFFSGLFKRLAIFSLATLILFYFASSSVIDKLKVPGQFSVYILAIFLSVSCLIPLFTGALMGFEMFGWFSTVSVTAGIVKFVLVLVFFGLGFGIAGALGAFLASAFISIVLFYLPLKDYITFGIEEKGADFRKFFAYLFPVAVSLFCFMSLVNSDMILVKYYFSPENAGPYSLAQMVGKILLFLPSAISMVMFPKTSGQHAKNLDTTATLKRSLLYGIGLCGIAAACYNVWPQFSLKLLTGKTTAEAVLLGRMFSFSMAFFALSFIMILYFLSKNDLRFIRWLVLSVILQVAGIALFHGSLFQVQAVLCVNAVLLFAIHLALFHRPLRQRQ